MVNVRSGVVAAILEWDPGNGDPKPSSSPRVTSPLSGLLSQHFHRSSGGSPCPLTLDGALQMDLKW